MAEELDEFDSYKKNQKRRFKEVDEKITDCLDPRSCRI